MISDAKIDQMGKLVALPGCPFSIFQLASNLWDDTWLCTNTLFFSNSLSSDIFGILDDPFLNSLFPEVAK